MAYRVLTRCWPEVAFLVLAACLIAGCASPSTPPSPVLTLPQPLEQTRPQPPARVMEPIPPIPYLRAGTSPSV